MPKLLTVQVQDVPCPRCGAEAGRSCPQEKSCRGRRAIAIAHHAKSRAYRRRVESFWEKVDKSGDCWLWMGARHASKWDYGSMHRKGMPVTAHSYAYVLTHGPIPDGMVVMHVCDNPPCCNPSHLRLGTLKDNAVDMVMKCRHANQRLTPTDVLDIRARIEGGELQRVIAAHYGVHRMTIGHIVTGATWSHLK